MQILTRFLIAISFFNFQLIPARAASPVVSTRDQIEVLTQLFAQTTKNTQNLAYLLSIGKSVPEDTKKIITHVETTIGGSEFPAMGILNNEFYFNGEASGIKIIGYQPLQVEYKNKTWSFDSKASSASNYFSLIKMLDEKPRSALLEKILPSANAQEEVYKAKKYGAIAAGIVVVAGVVYLVFAPVTVPATLIIAGGALVAGTAGAAYGYKKGQAQLSDVDMLFRSKSMRIDCTPERVVVSGQFNGKSVAVRFERTAQADPDMLAQWRKAVTDKVFGPAIKKSNTNYSYYLSSQFGSNPSEVSPNNSLQRSGSSFEKMAFFTAQQGKALSLMESCTDLKKYNQDCFAKNQEQCAQIDTNLPYDQWQIAAKKQDECIRKNSAIRDGKCVLNFQMYNEYVGWRPPMKPRAGTKTSK